MKDKICLVTGANVGIGKYTSLGLAQAGATVIMCARNHSQVELAKQEIIKLTGNEKIHLLIADLSSMKQVGDLANTVLDRFEKLDVLVNNTGLFLTQYQETVDGFETQWAVNYLAPFLLTNKLLELLKRSGAARIINVSSNAHLKGTIDFSDLNGKQNYQGLNAYSQSKLGNVLFTKELSNRLRETQVTTNALHPGVVKTSIGNRNNKSWVAWIWSLGKPLMISVEKGARTSLYLATSPQVAEVSGSYFNKSRPATSSDLSNDPELAKQLWDVTTELVKPYF